MQEIKRTEVPKLVFKPTVNEWQTLERQQQSSITKALANPIRSTVYEALEGGPMRQAVLARHISKSLGKKISNALLRHHLRQLLDAELIEFEVNSRISKRLKMVYRAADVRVQLRPRERQAGLTEREAPRTQEEFAEELKRALKKSFATNSRKRMSTDREKKAER